MTRVKDLAEVPGAPWQTSDATRRTEILRIADDVIASSGLRTSLQQIADAAGILAGSLYHHFTSKEEILVELIRRYHADLDSIGDIALARSDGSDPRPYSVQIVELARGIARCAVNHRAALQMSIYEGPSTDPELIEVTQRRPEKVIAAMLRTLRAARAAGYIRSDIELPTLADRMCQSMLRVGLDTIREKAAGDAVAVLLCKVLLCGLAAAAPNDGSLDSSNAFGAAQHVIGTWTDDEDAESSDRAAYIRAIARAEFGRRGYEMTTVRDIAAATGLGTGTVYRAIGSKEALLTSIMLSFVHKVGTGWTSVLATESTPVEKLDALSWVNVNALDRFPDEFRIQLAWMRQSPPDVANPGWSLTTRLRQMKSLLTEGVRSGEIVVDTPSTEMLARCIIGEQWLPENILRDLGKRQALIHARDTILRGVARRDQ
jgi:AcrR family transcriptional regulator